MVEGDSKPQWNFTEIADFLGGTSEEVTDPHFGEGNSIKVTDKDGNDSTEIEIYPGANAGFIRQPANDFNATLYDPKPPVLNDMGVVFNVKEFIGTTSSELAVGLHIQAEGEVKVTIMPARRRGSNSAGKKANQKTIPGRP